MKKATFFLLFLTSCSYSPPSDSFVTIQIQDRNNFTETISAPEKLQALQEVDFFHAQPYKKVIRMFRGRGKSSSKITTYHPNGTIWQYLEAEEMRALGAYKEWHSNGNLRIDTRVIGGTADVSPSAQTDWLFDGISKVYDEKGNLTAQISYKNGVLHGDSITYFPDGIEKRIVPYEDGVIEGILIEKHENGSAYISTTFKKGQKQGKSTGYFMQGGLLFEEEYVDDLLLNGYYYNPQGKIISKVQDGQGFRSIFKGNALNYVVQVQHGFVEGNVKEFTKNGEVQSIYHIKNGKKSGEETIYFLPHELGEGKRSSLQPKLTVQWEEGLIHGTTKTWYSNGQQQSQRDFCQNKKMGPALSWYKNGSLMLVEEYEKDHLVKGEYYKKNALDSCSSIINGSGIATLFDENGIFLKKVSYSKGDPVQPDE